MFRLKNLSKDFTTKIIEQAAGKIQQNVLEDFLSSIERETRQHYFTHSSESNLLRIIQHQFDIVFFINECLKYPHQIEVLITIASNSNYLTDILVRNPEYFFWINSPSVINQSISEKYYSNLLKNSLSTFKSFNAKVNVIRNFKRKEILRIGLKDIFLKEDLKSVTNYLSKLALIISAELFELCLDEILQKYKIDKIRNKYVLISLGKLGGNELNYSSDIDLIAFYDKNTLIDKRIYFSQILSEAILLFIDIASQKTGSGFLYRVDFRLRPNGKNAPLCGSYIEYLRYYETRGEDWERQMLIKTNFLCGSKTLYNKFYEYVSKFVYPSSFSIPPTEQIKKLKTSIERQISGESNIKLIAGGIRDIEFSLQALQLINGGKDLSIRTNNTLDAINKLQNKKIITDNESAILKEAYILYRKVEHYLQLMNDRQTHTIPADGELAEKLAYYLGFKDKRSFRNQIDRNRIAVQNIFNSIMGVGTPDNKIFNTSSINFADSKRSQKNLEFLRTGKSLFDKKEFDTRTTISFEKIENQLISFLTYSIDPDLVLENFTRVIRTAHFPKIWFDEFSDGNFLNLFLQICERSQKAINLFAEDKILRDEFLSRESLVPLNKKNIQSLQLNSFLFRAAIQILSKTVKTNLFSELFSEYIRLNIINIISDFSRGKIWEDDFFVAGMGSFGSEQLNFSSDIDLIFVLKNLNKFPDVQKDFQELLQKLKEYFKGIEIDCRLRPEGKSSLLVWDIKDYKKYFSTRARIWELQAFTKCRFIYGDEFLFEEFITHYVNTVRDKDKQQIKTDIFEMRKKLLPINQSSFNIKKSPGGLVDIDFIVTYLLLLNPSIISAKKDQNIFNSMDILENIPDDKIDFQTLHQNFKFLKNIQLSIQTTFDSKIAIIPVDEKKLFKLSRVLEFDNSKSFQLKLNDVISQVKKTFQDIFK